MNQALLNKIRKISGLLATKEGLLLYQCAKNKLPNGTIAEIGSFKGKSTIFLATGLKEIKSKDKIYAIDPHPQKKYLGQNWNNFNEFNNNILKYKLTKYVIPIRKTSQNVAKNWKKPIALLHIDGLHDYEHVRQDLKLYLPYLIEGGTVVCHDALAPEPDVMRAINDEIFISGSFSELGTVDSQVFAIKGKTENLFQKFRFIISVLFFKISSLVMRIKILPLKLRWFIVNRILKKGFFIQQTIDFLPSELI